MHNNLLQLGDFQHLLTLHSKSDSFTIWQWFKIPSSCLQKWTFLFPNKLQLLLKSQRILTFYYVRCFEGKKAEQTTANFIEIVQDWRYSGLPNYGLISIVKHYLVMWQGQKVSQIEVWCHYVRSIEAWWCAPNHSCMQMHYWVIQRQKTKRIN